MLYCSAGELQMEEIHGGTRNNVMSNNIKVKGWYLFCNSDVDVRLCWPLVELKMSQTNALWQIKWFYTHTVCHSAVGVTVWHSSEKLYKCMTNIDKGSLLRCNGLSKLFLKLGSPFVCKARQVLWYNMTRLWCFVTCDPGRQDLKGSTASSYNKNMNNSMQGP